MWASVHETLLRIGPRQESTHFQRSSLAQEWDWTGDDCCTGADSVAYVSYATQILINYAILYNKYSF